MGFKVESKSNTNVSTTANYRVYTVKKNDSLWKISKNELGKKATKTEIANYSNKIVKINKIKNPNTIFAKTNLYLPDLPEKSKNTPVQTQTVKTKPAAVPAKPAVKNVQKSVVKTAPKATAAKTTAVKQAENKTNKTVNNAAPKKFVPKTDAEKGLATFLENIKDETLFVQKGSIVEYHNSTKTYHVYTRDNRGMLKLQGSFETTANGEFLELSFEAPNNIYPYGYDYVLDKDGKMYKDYDADIWGKKNIPPQGEISEQIVEKMFNYLSKKILKDK